MDGEKIHVQGMLPLALITGVVIELFIQFLGLICCAFLFFGGAFAEIILRERSRYGIKGALLIGALVGLSAALTGISLDFFWGKFDESHISYAVPGSIEKMKRIGYSDVQTAQFGQIAESEGFRYIIIMVSIFIKLSLYPAFSIIGALLAKGFWK